MSGTGPDGMRVLKPNARTTLRSSRIIERALVFTLIWAILVEGYPGSWTFGVGFVILATVTSLLLTPVHTWHVRPIGMIRFAGFFVWHSVAGGVDVALRAIRPSMPISPALVSCPMRMADESARVLLADTVSLLPGTLSAGLSGDMLVIHVLDDRLPIVEDVRRVEERVADALGIDLISPVPLGTEPPHSATREADDSAR